MDHPYDAYRRRASDRLTPEEQADLDESFARCPAFGNHIELRVLHDDLRRILETQQEQKALQEEQAVELKKVAEILEAWDNAKGFVKTVRLIGEVSKWIVAAGAAVGIIWYFLAHGATPPK